MSAFVRKTSNIIVLVFLVFTVLLISSCAEMDNLATLVRTGYIKVENPNYHPIGSGTYKDGIKNGHGEIRWKNGDYYVGELKDGVQHGKGITVLSGDRYEGDFYNSHMHGKGVYQHTNGQKYEGNFVHDVRQGKGIYTWPDGDRYEGNFANDIFHGEGILYKSNGGIYKQVWNQGNLVSREKVK